MTRSLVGACFLLFCVSFTFSQEPFLPSEHWIKLRDEASGVLPYENLRYLTRLHRVPATSEFDQAAQFVLERVREYGLMLSYLGWKVESGQLWEMRPRHLLLGDWATDPIRLADYSHSADVEADLVDVGDGSHDADYSGKDVR